MARISDAFPAWVQLVTRVTAAWQEPPATSSAGHACMPGSYPALQVLRYTVYGAVLDFQTAWHYGLHCACPTSIVVHALRSRVSGHGLAPRRSCVGQPELHQQLLDKADPERW